MHLWKVGQLGFTCTRSCPHCFIDINIWLCSVLWGILHNVNALQHGDGMLEYRSVLMGKGLCCRGLNPPNILTSNPSIANMVEQNLKDQLSRVTLVESYMHQGNAWLWSWAHHSIWSPSYTYLTLPRLWPPLPSCSVLFFVGFVKSLIWMNSFHLELELKLCDLFELYDSNEKCFVLFWGTVLTWFTTTLFKCLYLNHSRVLSDLCCAVWTVSIPRSTLLNRSAARRMGHLLHNKTRRFVRKTS